MQNDHKEYQCASNTCWIVEQQGILLINTSENRYSRLHYPEAAIWDLLTRNWPYAHLLRMLAVIFSLNSDEAVLLLEQSLEQWIANGWLIERITP